MATVLGLGGIFFKSPDPIKLSQWYAQTLGLKVETQGMSFALFFPTSLPSNAYSVWSAFESNSTYFSPSKNDFMINLIVDNLEEALEQVQAGGGQLVGTPEKSEYGYFGWFMDPDGNKVELWQPPEA